MSRRDTIWHMKPDLVILLVLAFWISPCRAQDASSTTAPQTTESMSNGRRWRAMADADKLVWILAYRDGLTIAFIHSRNPDDTREIFISHMRQLFPEKLTYGEVRSALDHFFETPENRPIPIGEALAVVVMTAAGGKQSIIDDHVSELRRISSMDPSK